MVQTPDTRSFSSAYTRLGIKVSKLRDSIENAEQPNAVKLDTKNAVVKTSFMNPNPTQRAREDANAANTLLKAS